MSDDGLSHDDEFDALCGYEDSIENAIESSEIYYVGRITTQGMRQFYFYSADSSLFEDKIKRVLELKSEYQFIKLVPTQILNGVNSIMCCTLESMV